LLAEYRVKIGQKNISAWWFILGAAVVAFLIYVSTMQVVINGLTDPYTTDVGEIQNALPRWGTLHFTGYPQYTFIGSIFVTILGWLGMAPAAAASLYSAVWGAISIALLVWLIIELDVPTHLAVIPALLFGLSGSMWMDASIAELHTMTMALTFGALATAVRFGRDGKNSDLYWLAFLSGQGLAHQRAFAFMGLGLLILVIHQWRLLLDWKRLLIVIGLMLLGPLTYIYLPLRAWMGADWTFSSPGTWEGFKALIFDTKADRIVSTPSSLAEMTERTREILRLLNDDWPWPVWVFGLLGLFLPGRSWRERWGLTFVWLPYFVLSLIIWEGRVSDALLAVKMPIIAMSGLGLAFWTQQAWQRSRVLGYIAMAVLLLFGGYLFVTQRQVVLAITRDESAYELIELTAAIPPAADSRPQTLMALWGDDFWPLAYAQTYEGYYPDLNVVHHDNDFAAIVRRGDHLLTLSRTFYQRPVAWWQEILGPVYLTSVAPEIVEIQVEPRVTAVSPADTLLDLGNGIAIRDAQLVWTDDNTLHLAVEWQALQDDLSDYSIAVHLVAQDPPIGPQDILTQADRNHPVAGWYPSSLWQAGEVVTDHFLLEVPEGGEPVAVRVGMYQALADGTFANSEWLSLPVP
jgi:hypothetical protein